MLVDAEDVDEDARRADGQVVVMTEPGRKKVIKPCLVHACMVPAGISPKGKAPSAVALMHAPDNGPTGVKHVNNPKDMMGVCRRTRSNGAN